MAFFESDNKAMPTPSELTINNELIWSSDTGRTLAGKMCGNVVSEKMTISLKWYLLTDDEYMVLKAGLKSGFFSINLSGIGEKVVYHSTLVGHRKMVRDGLKWSDVTVDLIER